MLVSEYVERCPQENIKSLYLEMCRSLSVVAATGGYLYSDFQLPSTLIEQFGPLPGTEGSDHYAFSSVTTSSCPGSR